MSAEDDATRSVAQSLVMLGTSETKWLEILRGEPLSEDFHQVLLSMKNLRTLTFSLCKDLHSFILALAPVPNSPDPMICPKLEELTFRTAERFDIETMIEVAAARASGGSPLKSVNIINWGELVAREGAMKLRKHVSHVGTGSETSNVDFGITAACAVDYGYGDGSDEEDWEQGGFSDDSSIS